MEKEVNQFICFVKENHLPVNAIVLANEEQILIQHEFVHYPYRNIYSHTKSFTATLVGIAIDENLFDLQTKIYDLLKDEIKEEPSTLFKEVTIHVLLTMSGGFDRGYLMENERRKGEGFPSYGQYIFHLPLVYQPGSTFCYSNVNTHLLSMAIRKKTGKSMLHYAYEKLFRPLEMPYPVWEHDPSGDTFGASGLYLSTVEMNKLGRLYLNRGVFHNKRIVSEKWVQQVETPQIDTHIKDSWSCQYSYQFWMMPYHNGYRADGMFGQLTMIFPRDHYALSIQCPEDGNFNLVLHTLKEIILEPYFKNKK